MSNGCDGMGIWESLEEGVWRLLDTTLCCNFLFLETLDQAHNYNPISSKMNELPRWKAAVGFKDSLPTEPSTLDHQYP